MGSGRLCFGRPMSHVKPVSDFPAPYLVLAQVEMVEHGMCVLQSSSVSGRCIIGAGILSMN